MNGIKKHIRNTSRLELVGCVLILALGVSLSLAIVRIEKNAGPEGHEHGGEHHDEGEKEGIELSEESMAYGKISIDEAQPRPLVQKTRLRGRVVAHGDRLLDIKARFPGTIYSVSKNAGASVRKGEVLARVENIASRSSFDVISGISGVIVDCSVVRGSFVSEMEHLFTVVDTSLVWVDLNVFLNDIGRIKTGQSVEISSVENETKGNCKISYVSPLVDEDTQTFKIRCELENKDGAWRPGGFIEADVITETAQAKVAIKRDAIQDLEGKRVIFVQKNERIQSREVSLGKSDEVFVEILSGIDPGERYVAQNSFVVKAELLKSTAGHEH